MYFKSFIFLKDYETFITNWGTLVLIEEFKTNKQKEEKMFIKKLKGYGIWLEMIYENTTINKNTFCA